VLSSNSFFYIKALKSKSKNLKNNENTKKKRLQSTESSEKLAITPNIYSEAWNAFSK
jgi:hypothetical protein